MTKTKWNIVFLPFLVSLNLTSSPTFRLSNWSKYVKAEFGPSWGLGRPKMFTKPPAHHPQMQKYPNYWGIFMVWCSIYFSIMQRLKQNHQVFFEFWLNYSIFMSGRVVKLTEEELDCIGFCFTMVAAVSTTLFSSNSLQNFFSTLLCNTLLQHFSSTPFPIFFSPNLLLQLLSTTLPAEGKGPNSWCIFISCCTWMEANRRLFKCKSTPCCQSDFCFLLFFLDGRRGAFVKPQEPRALMDSYGL